MGGVGGNDALIKSLLIVAAFSHLDDSCGDKLGDRVHFGVVVTGSRASTSIVWTVVKSGNVSDTTVCTVECCGQCCPSSFADNVNHSYMSWKVGSWSVSN